MSSEHCDALVIYGVTGDLAFKKIFPALQAMVRRGHLDVRHRSISPRPRELEKEDAELWMRPAYRSETLRGSSCGLD